MGATTKIFQRCFIVVALCLFYSTLMAQNEVARERSSLRGIQAMGFTVNLESSTSLTGFDEIEVTSLIEMGQEMLNKSNITLIPEKEVQRSDEIPLLFLHVNSMDAGRGLVPFSLSLYLYQPVKLMLNRDMQTSAITWESGYVGIVSYDKVSLIRDAAKSLINEFINDYKQTNDPN